MKTWGKIHPHPPLRKEPFDFPLMLRKLLGVAGRCQIHHCESTVYEKYCII